VHLTANISIPQKNFIAIDLHSDNAVICVRRNALNKAGELVGKISGAVGSASVTDSTISSKRFCHTVRIPITLPWSNSLTTGIAWQMSLKSAVGCFALRIQAPSVKPTSNPPMTVPTLNILPSDCESVLLITTCR